MKDDQLTYLGIWTGDIERIVERVISDLRQEEYLGDDAELNVGPDANIDTVGELIDEIAKALAAVAPGIEVKP
ncbi:MAG: hypothetical protein WDN08_05470 [Rhizomicrobium sp.]